MGTAFCKPRQMLYTNGRIGFDLLGDHLVLREISTFRKAPELIEHAVTVGHDRIGAKDHLDSEQGAVLEISDLGGMHGAVRQARVPFDEIALGPVCIFSVAATPRFVPRRRSPYGTR